MSSRSASVASSKRSKAKEDGWVSDVSVSKMGAGKPLKDIPLAKGKVAKTLRPRPSTISEESVPKGCTMDKEDLIDNILRMQKEIAQHKAKQAKMDKEIKEKEEENLRMKKELKFRESDGHANLLKTVLEEDAKSLDEMSKSEIRMLGEILELELRILIDDMKANMPKLEKEVLKLEKKCNEQEKNGPTDLQQAYNDLPAIYRMKPSEQEVEFQRMRDEQEELEKKVEIERKRLEDEKSVETEALRKSRAECDRLVEENAALELEIAKEKRLNAAEIVTGDMVLRDMSTLRSRICNEDFSSPRESSSWYRHAFLMPVGDPNGTMNINDVAESVKLWVADDEEIYENVDERIVYAISEMKRLKNDGTVGTIDTTTGDIHITIEEYVNMLLIALECYK